MPLSNARNHIIGVSAQAIEKIQSCKQNYKLGYHNKLQMAKIFEDNFEYDESMKVTKNKFFFI